MNTLVAGGLIAGSVLVALGVGVWLIVRFARSEARHRANIKAHEKARVVEAEYAERTVAEDHQHLLDRIRRRRAEQLSPELREPANGHRRPPGVPGADGGDAD